MKAVATELTGVMVLEPKVFGDARGFFMESWNAQRFKDVLEVDVNFVQDNHSRSAQGVLRGIHYQLEKPQGKLVRVTRGAVLDVVVDLRRSSPTFGRYVSFELSEDNHRQVWIPPGYGHGFCVLSDTADFLYKTTEYWYPEFERSVNWADPVLNIDWRVTNPQLAQKDAIAPMLSDAVVYD